MAKLHRMVVHKHRAFILPSVIISSIVMLTVLSVSVSSTVTIRTALKEQYYSQLSQTAGEAGLEYARSCLRANSNKPLWTDAKPLRPNTDCSGNDLVSCPTTSSDSACSVLLNGNIRTTFSIPLPTLDSSGFVTYIKYNGSVELLRTSSKVVWKTFEQRGNWQVDANLAAVDGSSAANAAPSAAYIKSLGINADGVYWINLPTVGPTQVYCILNSAYDGGGWMMMLKATTGTTFNYSANYWTTANTLNPTQTNRNNGDAKFDVMNYFGAKDIMAVFPDIPTATYGAGSISGVSEFTWLENNFNNSTSITPINFFNISYPTMTNGGSGKFIKDAKTFSGWKSGVFSSQVDIRFYGFNYINNPSYGVSGKVRWGFGWNENGEGLFPSNNVSYIGTNDVSGGIGMDGSFGSYSAGDKINCCQDNTGINRSARVEVYVR